MWRMAIKDFIVNVFYKIRFSFYRKFLKSKIKNYSKNEKSGFKLKFEDNFENVSWEGEKWDIGESWGLVHPKMLNCYKSAPINRGDKAVFIAKYNPKKFIVEGEEIEIPFETSWISSHNTHIQKYGRWECRMTLPKGKATWPAFWTWGQQWPPEIDIIEAYGKDEGEIYHQCINLHWGHDDQGGRNKMNAWKIRITNRGESLKFHEFAMEWNENGIYLFTDGIKIFQFTNKKILNKWFNNFGGKHRTLVNHNLKNDGVYGTRYLTEFEIKDYYSEFLVDYVRIYQYE